MSTWICTQVLSSSDQDSSTHLQLRPFEDRCTSAERHNAVDRPDGKMEENPLEFARLAHTFEKLEKTSSRLALMATLVELFRAIYSSPDAETILTKMGVVVVQYKYDGLRTQIHKDGQQVSIFSLIEPSVWLEPEMVIEVLADEITCSHINTA